MYRVLRATDDRYQEFDQPGSGSTGDGSHNRVSWNSRVRYAKDVVEEAKEALEDQSTRLGGK